MISFPNAKINLGLRIVSKRADGYHNLETVFYPIGLKDALEIIPSGSNEKYRFFLSGTPLDAHKDENLVIKALKRISGEKEIPPLDIHLLKKIPTGAGLGGGSSDAAFMLKLLNETFSLNYSEAELIRLAATLGADCPFFIQNKPAFATGIGDCLEAVELNLDSFFIVLVKPDIAVSTKEAYALITPRQPRSSLKEIIGRPVSEWRETMKNDFEEPVFKKHPEIADIKKQLYSLGASYASMSGSGSAVFGLFDKKPDLAGHFAHHFVWTEE
ncbi:4-(cytidine 5'-diphospho)-2-C-methyl-D-erythritol kinase [Limibacterium fermenti]|uniref:4-(cytidine 5'-diphospho)-2-C-methyl-D-erythritol kinase n=1 Tax=Limibacterium fermenti TaxID=3229863 RepID=UPI000E83ACEF|nr:4-(cytidine 5'-diphospho)-2-C-methyl-D-erythritol kinase [Porphyromonadaceae bacterium]HBX46569.1 4-(cytidine 5'-diphospho)-2-C-methyl-D-erythritol kinase [Porphyromonadaceae bacterium]